VADHTEATRRRRGLIVGVGLVAAVVATSVFRVLGDSSDPEGVLDIAASDSSGPSGGGVEPLVEEPFAGADSARLPADARERWSIELAGLVATDRTRLFVDGGRSVLALLDRVDPTGTDTGEVVAIDAATGRERWRVSFERGTGSLRILGVLDDVAMIERLHPDDRAIVGFDIDTGAELWAQPVAEPGLNRVLDGTALVTRIGVSDGSGLVFIDPVSGDELGRVSGELFSTDLLGRWYVRNGDSIVELDLRDGWSPPTALGRLTDPDTDVAAVVDAQLLEADGNTLTVSDATGGAPSKSYVLDELGPVASIRGLFPMVGPTFVLTTESETYGAVLVDDGVELRWQVDGRVVNTIATDRGLAVLTASAGGTDLRVVDASRGAAIAAVSSEPGALDTLRLVANGVVVERPAAIGVERVGLDLDGDPRWSLIGSGPVAIGDELVAVFAPTANGVRLVGYGIDRDGPVE
jgi:hypothetical protein